MNIGVIGTGDRGQGLIKLISKIEGMRLVTICDIRFRLDGATKYLQKAIKYSNYQLL